MKKIKRLRFKSMMKLYISGIVAWALGFAILSNPYARSHLARLFHFNRQETSLSKYAYRELALKRVHLSRASIGEIKPIPVRVSHIVERAAADHRLDPALVNAVIRVESGADPNAVSYRGARGLMQLMPATAKQLGVDINDPVQNIYGGTKYLRDMLDLFNNDVRLALAAYNAGPAIVLQYNGIPPFRETKDYVNKVMATYHGYRRFYS